MPDENSEMATSRVNRTTRSKGKQASRTKRVSPRTKGQVVSSITTRRATRKILEARNCNEAEKVSDSQPSLPIEKPTQKKHKVTLDPSWNVVAIGGHVRIDQISPSLEALLQRQKSVRVVPEASKIVGIQDDSDSSDSTDSSISDVETEGLQVYKKQKAKRIKIKYLTVQDYKANDIKLRIDNTVSLRRIPNRVYKMLQDRPYILDTAIGKPQRHVVPVEYLPKIVKKPSSSVDHKCYHHCGLRPLVPILDKLKRVVSPLALPFYYGWTRAEEQSKRVAKGKKFKGRIGSKAYYTTPCGISCFRYNEVREFLQLTFSPLEIESFCFQPSVDCLNELPPSNRTSFFIFEADISIGQELRKVERVNSLDLEPANALEYVANSVFGPNVTLDNENPFLACCSCEDDCRDKAKCNCWQMTLENEIMFNPNASAADTGYNNKKKLMKKLKGGIFECNQGFLAGLPQHNLSLLLCKCKKSCINRIVQNGLIWRLQVYKTTNKGYAVRAMEEIPRGSFVCIYAGEIIKHIDADRSQTMLGSGYTVDLDLIGAFDSTGNSFNFVGNEDNKELTLLQASRQRLLLGLDDAYFVVDAKRKGNVGRYFNHSYSPNLFVQPVFVDTHDLRLPCAAFFTSEVIKCGTELTWNYGYDCGYYDYMNFVI